MHAVLRRKEGKKKRKGRKANCLVNTPIAYACRLYVVLWGTRVVASLKPIIKLDMAGPARMGTYRHLLMNASLYGLRPCVLALACTGRTGQSTLYYRLGLLSSEM